MKILIGLPAYGGSIKLECVLSLLKLQGALVELNIPFGIVAPDTADVADARNVIADRFLASDCTHLLGVDSDMAFEPTSVTRMIATQKPFVGCAYPGRGMDIDALLDLTKSGTPKREAVARASAFKVEWPDPANVAVADSMAQAASIPMGLCLLNRSIFDRLIASGAIRRNAIAHRDPKYQWGFFDRLDENGVMLGEDISFCRRYRQAGGEIWLLVTEPVRHIGRFSYDGIMADWLSSLQRA